MARPSKSVRVKTGAIASDVEAVRQAVEWMFANTPVIRIFAAAYATNSASQRVLVKTGFRHVGTFRKAFFKNGAFVDGCYYELLKDENE